MLTSFVKPVDRAKRDYSYYKDIVTFENKRILDVGCGKGNKSNLISRHCSELVGIDFRRNFETALNNVNFIQADANHLPFKENAFDAAVSNDAFEHIPRPDECLKEVKRVIKKNGFMCINFGPLWRSPFGSHMDFKEHFLLPYGQLFFSENEITKMLWTFGKISYQDYNKQLFSHLNKLSISEFKKYIKQLELKVISFKLVSPFSLSFLLNTWFSEYIATQVVSVLKKID